MKKTNENGIGIVEIIMGVAIILLVIAVGYLFVKQQAAPAVSSVAKDTTKTSTTTSPTPTPSVAAANPLTVDNASARLQAAGLQVTYAGNKDSYYTQDGEVALYAASINNHKAIVYVTEFQNAQQATADVQNELKTMTDNTSYAEGKLSIVITNDVSTGSTKPDSMLVTQIKNALQ